MLASIGTMWRYTDAFLKEFGNVGFFLSVGAALEIVGDRYRILTGDPSYFKITPYALKGYFLDGEYHLEKLDLSSSFKTVDGLLSKNPVADESMRILTKKYPN